ncbi:ABC transporter permease [Seohaeicola zhoushanensis]|uniref:ABC transporter permease n=2 Tax=Seohaeicola zhoushanensis TaxID=1569283 RepID=A0A8J3MBW3_9RHOB|nr:ABC transporter permease [Seohaeicola zhoushanensis]
MMRRDLEAKFGPVVILLATFATIFLLLPVIFVVLHSFSPTRYFQWPPTEFTLKWHQDFYTSTMFMEAARNSLVMALIVTPLSLVIGVPASYALVRGTFPGKALIQQVILSPLIIPGVVTGVSLLSLYSAGGLRIGMFGLCLGMLIFALPFAVRAISANLIGIDPRVEEAARSLGAGPLRTFFVVVVPQLKSGVLAASVFIFVEAVDNFSIAVFLSNDQTRVLPVAAYQYIKDFDDPTVAAMATALIVLSVVLVMLLEKLIGFQKSLRL